MSFVGRVHNVEWDMSLLETLVYFGMMPESCDSAVEERGGHYDLSVSSSLSPFVLKLGHAHWTTLESVVIQMVL